MLKPDQIAELQAPLNPAHVAQRSQSGRALSYIEGWWAIAEANRIFGFDMWHRETVDVRCVAERERKLSSGKDGWSVSYTARVKVEVFAGDRCIVREGTGAGHGIDADLGLAHESAIKEAETDAMKRALMTFGNPFGLALYDKTQANVAAPDAGRKTPAQAKRDGDDARIKAAIQACADLEQLGAYGARQLIEEKARMPPQWQEAIDDMYLLRREELLGRDFREPVLDGVAGVNGHMEAAH
jgi:DNA recombination protein Rad52